MKPSSGIFLPLFLCVIEKFDFYLDEEQKS